MVAVLVVLTCVVLVVLDYYVLSRRARPAPLTERAAPPAPVPIAGERRPVPGEVFLQPTWTWSRMGDAGDLYVGVHPMLLELIGTPLSLDCRAHGDAVARGEPLVKLGRGERRVVVPSPVTGRVELVNYPALGGDDPWSASHARSGAWLYRIVPERLADDMRGWLSGDAASAWTMRRYHELREFLTHAAADRHLGVVMADGGELPAGIMGDMDDHVWAGLQERLTETAAGHAVTETTP